MIEAFVRPPSRRRPSRMNTSLSAAPDELLDRMEYQADPLADATIAAILGPWDATAAAAPVAVGALQSLHAEQWRRLEAVNRVFAQWETNLGIETWRADASVPPEVAGPLRGLRAPGAGTAGLGRPRRDRRAPSSCSSTRACCRARCCSAPACPSATWCPTSPEVLHTTGQLEQRTEYRIRTHRGDGLPGDDARRPRRDPTAAASRRCSRCA